LHGGQPFSQVLAELESSLVSTDQILVIFMENEPAQVKGTGRTSEIHSKAFEVGMASATGSAVIGASIGFVLAWGPIIWGLICVIIGFTIGYCVYYFLKKEKVHTHRIKKEAEILVIIQCTEILAHPIREILWKYQALTVGKTEDTPS
jgi:hypothetical protein